MSTIPLGEDILLARHGSNIAKFRQDRKNRVTIAYLIDGAQDTASNELSVSVLSPAASISRSAEAYLDNKTAISRSDIRSLAKISLGFTAAMSCLFGGLMYVAYRAGGTELVESLTTAYMSYPL